MGQLMFFYAEVDGLESTKEAELRDSTYDHTVFAEVHGSMDELEEVCEKWGMSYNVTYEGEQVKEVEIG